MKYIPADIYCLQPNAKQIAERDTMIVTQRAVIADLLAQIEAVKAHHAEVRTQFERRYTALILRVNRAEREAAKWEGIAKGLIEEVTE